MTDKMAAEEMKTAVDMFEDFSTIQDHKVCSIFWPLCPRYFLKVENLYP